MSHLQNVIYNNIVYGFNNINMLYEDILDIGGYKSLIN